MGIIYIIGPALKDESFVVDLTNTPPASVVRYGPVSFWSRLWQVMIFRISAEIGTERTSFEAAKIIVKKADLPIRLGARCENNTTQYERNF